METQPKGTVSYFLLEQEKIKTYQCQCELCGWLSTRVPLHEIVNAANEHADRCGAREGLASHKTSANPMQALTYWTVVKRLLKSMGFRVTKPEPRQGYRVCCWDSQCRQKSPLGNLDESTDWMILHARTHHPDSQQIQLLMPVDLSKSGLVTQAN